MNLRFCKILPRTHRTYWHLTLILFFYVSANRCFCYLMGQPKCRQMLVWRPRPYLEDSDLQCISCEKKQGKKKEKRKEKERKKEKEGTRKKKEKERYATFPEPLPAPRPARIAAFQVWQSVAICTEDLRGRPLIRHLGDAILRTPL